MTSVSAAVPGEAEDEVGSDDALFMRRTYSFCEKPSTLGTISPRGHPEPLSTKPLIKCHSEQAKRCRRIVEGSVPEKYSQSNNVRTKRALILRLRCAPLRMTAR